MPAAPMEPTISTSDSRRAVRAIVFAARRPIGGSITWCAVQNSIAKVVVDLALDREFDYRIPAHLATLVHVGSRVVVPFGRRSARGYVVGLADSSTYDKLKDI